MSLTRYTLAIIKPDILEKQSKSIEKILSTIQEKFIIHEKKQLQLTIEQAEQFYSDHRGKFFYERLVCFMSRGPIIPLVLSEKNVNSSSSIKPWRDFIGPTHRDKAREINCLRGQFGTSDTKNAFHGSGSEKEAVDEIKFFFPDFKSDL
ncbi:hypothetical protein CYY_000288 [Polysphondylium violaceum]|uniref:Nucleoside diphosphate kinase-like domain-containing protein n=1 Tax=Polysphondylium violaceum TaxID=133409 RepID=A0A8J4UXB7_9MYCE|nr:hypothetical protein CYY_000288 [Polysphondylium violaceum]